MAGKSSERPIIAAADRVTVLFSPPQFPACKSFTRGADGEIQKRGYNAGMRYAYSEFPVNGIRDLSELLGALEGQSQALVIRGAPRSGLDKEALHYRRKVNFMTPREGRRWVMVDVDKLRLPKGLSLRSDVRAVLRHIISLLPKELQNVSFHWQLSSSAGMNEEGIESMHLWFWLAEPATDEELKRWAGAANKAAGFEIIDTALFRDVQPHYTARPMFKGLADPFQIRSGLHIAERDSAALNIPEVVVSQQMGRGGQSQSEPSSVGFDAKLAEIGDHPGGQGFRKAILSATASYARQFGVDEGNRLVIAEKIRAVAMAAVRDSSRSEEEIDEKASLDIILKMLDSGAKKYPKLGAARRKATLGHKLQPRYSAAPLTAADAANRVHAAIADAFECE